MADPSIYDLLAKQSISDLTVANLNSATKHSAIDPVNIEFWSGVITVARAMEESRTMAHGLPIPESGTVHIETIADSAAATIAPEGTEGWQVLHIHLSGCSAGLVDGSGNVSPYDASLQRPCGSLFLSRHMSLAFSNASGSTQTPSIAYFKVAL